MKDKSEKSNRVERLKKIKAGGEDSPYRWRSARHRLVLEEHWGGVGGRVVSGGVVLGVCCQANGLVSEVSSEPGRGPLSRTAASDHECKHVWFPKVAPSPPPPPPPPWHRWSSRFLTWRVSKCTMGAVGGWGWSWHPGVPGLFAHVLWH